MPRRRHPERYTRLSLDPLSSIALSALLAWASGLRLYLVVFALGLLTRFGFITPTGDLAWLANTWVIGAAGTLAVVEFFADKIPGIDSIWDALHTFIRVPAGAGLAAAAMGFDQHNAALLAGLLGGTLTTGTHLSKAGTRALINTSPEPVSNWVASFGEDGMVVGGIWVALLHPLAFLLLLALFTLTAACMLPRLWRGARRLLTRWRP